MQEFSIFKTLKDKILQMLQAVTSNMELSICLGHYRGFQFKKESKIASAKALAYKHSQRHTGGQEKPMNIM